MTSPTDTIRYVVDLDDRGATRGLKRLADGMQDVDRLGANLKKSQLASADAAGKLRVAEAKLDDVRKTGKAKAAQLAAAEESVASAQRRLVSSTDEAKRAAAGLARAQDHAGDSTRRLKRAADDSGRGFVSMRKSIGGVSLGIGQALHGIAPFGISIGAVGALTVGLGLKLYNTASNLELMDRKARIVFGRSFPELASWARKVSAQFGMTSREVLSLTAGFADMLVPMGFSRDVAATMARKFAAMAPILSQWSGGQFDVQQTSEALTGALTGEYDTLQRLGIPISAAQVDAEVLKEKQKGLKFATEGQAKAAAALALIYAGSTDAQKAFGAGQETLAAKANRAKARFGELRDAILVGLIPVFDQFATWFTNHQDDIINFGFRAARGFVDFGEGASLALASVLDGIGDVMVGLGHFLAASNTTWSGILGGATIVLGTIFPSMRKRLVEGAQQFEDFRRHAGESLISTGQRTKDMADGIRRNVPPAADLARRKIDDVRRAALGLPPNPKVNVTAPGAVASRTQVQKFHNELKDLPPRRTVGVDVKIRGTDVTYSAAGSATRGRAFAYGGMIPGYSPSDRSDNVDIRATAGEFVVQRPTARKLERRAPGFLAALNAGQLDIGGDPGAMIVAVGHKVRQRPKFADGGLIRRAQQVVLGEVGDSYIWGGVGPFGADCSGYAGQPYGILTGRTPYARYMTTASNFTALGFRRGRGTYTLGVSPAAGHMAFNIAGLAAEATPPRLRSGRSAAPVTSFAQQWYLPSAGGVFGGMPGLTRAQIQGAVRFMRPRIIAEIFRELGVRQADNGAWLPPRSVTAVENRTSQWEPVGPPGPRGPLLNVENLHMHDGVDADLLASKLGFLERAGQFG